MYKLDFDMLGKIHKQDTVRTKYFCEDETLRDNSFVGITNENKRNWFAWSRCMKS